MAAADRHGGRYEITDEMRATAAGFLSVTMRRRRETAEEIRTWCMRRPDMCWIPIRQSLLTCIVKWKEQNHPTAPVVIASTASPFKFARSVMSAIDVKYAGMEDFALIDELSRIANVPVPKAVEEIRNAPVLHDKVIETGEMSDAVKSFLGISK